MRLICQVPFLDQPNAVGGNAEGPNFRSLPAAHSAEPLPLNSQHSPRFLLAMGKRIVNGEIVDDGADGSHSMSSSARPQSRHVFWYSNGKHTF